VAGAEKRLLHPERPPIERLRLVRVPLRLADSREVTQRDRNLVMLRSKGPLEHGEGAAIHLLGLVMAPLAVDDGRERRDIGSDAWMIGPERTLPKFHRPARRRFTLV
jgi:hypothetical protein